MTIPTLVRAEIFADIADECLAQDEQWGTVEGTENFGGRSHHFWNVILGEEIGEVSKGLLDGDTIQEIRYELVQCAAVIAQWIEAIDRGKIGEGLK